MRSGRRTVARGVAPISAAVALFALLMGCTNLNPSASETSVPHATAPGSSIKRQPPNVSPGLPFNGQDLLFTERWLAHASQTIESAKVVSSKTTNSEVRDFANQVRSRAEGDTRTMQELRKRWSQPVSAGVYIAPRAELPLGERMIVPDEDVPEWDIVPPAELDKTLLDFVLNHSRDALIPLDDEARAGKDTDTKNLAAAINANVLAEVKRAQELKQALAGG